VAAFVVDWVGVVAWRWCWWKWADEIVTVMVLELVLKAAELLVWM